MIATGIPLVDWSTIPAPEDDGAAAHLMGSRAPDLALPGTDGQSHNLAGQKGRIILFCYPKTGLPGQGMPTADWDMIPGARGCTPQTCAFRDLAQDFAAHGARLLGLSTQSRAYQQEMATRLHVPFPILSDVDLALQRAWQLPAMLVEGETLLKRMALVLDDGIVRAVFYPVFPPDRNAPDVLDWVIRNPIVA
jgi:peroxiredoxin